MIGNWIEVKNSKFKKQVDLPSAKKYQLTIVRVVITMVLMALILLFAAMQIVHWYYLMLKEPALLTGRTGTF